MTWFRPFASSPDLDDILACRYVANSAGRHDLLPDGCMDLVWTADIGVMLCGPDTRAWSFDMEAGVEMAGIRFRPGAAAGVFDADAASLVDRRVSLEDLLGGRTGRLLADRLHDADPITRMALLEDLVRRRSTSLDPTVALAAELQIDPGASAGDLVERSGVSARQLRRRFDRAVGYGPAFLARVARLQRFAAGAVRRPDLGLAELAATAGYADQSHLAKDSRAIAGRTPRQLVAVLDRSSLAVDVRSVQDVAGVERPPWAA